MAFSSALGLISRRGYRGVSNLNYGGSCVSRSFPSVESVSTGRTSPWLMLPPAKEGRNVVYDFFSLAENRVLSFNWGEGYCTDFDPSDDYDTFIGSSQGWLGLINYGGYMALINPLTRRHIDLPSRVTPSSSVPCVTASKIILSCSPDDPDEGGEECRALISYGPQNILAFCCPDRSSGWTPIGGAKHYQSIVYSKRQKLFFCSRQGAYLEAWDLRDPLSPKLLLTQMDNPSLDFRHENAYTHNFLVINDDTDDLFLVRRFINKKKYDNMSRRFVSLHNKADSRAYKTITTLDVHRYDPWSSSFRYMEGGSLDGLSFFISNNTNGFALSAQEFPELKPNSIYFTKDVLNPRALNNDPGIFNYRDATFSPCCPPEESWSLPPEPWWFTPNTN